MKIETSGNLSSTINSMIDTLIHNRIMLTVIIHYLAELIANQRDIEVKEVLKEINDFANDLRPEIMKSAFEKIGEIKITDET